MKTYTINYYSPSGKACVHSVTKSSYDDIMEIKAADERDGWLFTLSHNSADCLIFSAR